MSEISFIMLLILSAVVVESQMMPGKAMVYGKLNETATIAFPQVANYRRKIRNAENVDEEHIFRVCNGKNKKTCGFWENVQTKKKVPSGATTYNKNKKSLVIKKLKATDFGDYMTGNKKISAFLKLQTW